MGTSNRWVMTDDGYSRSPVLCVDIKGKFHLSWISSKDGECIKHVVLGKDGTWSLPEQCSPFVSHITGLSMAPLGDGVVLMWTDGGVRAVSGLKLKTLGDQKNEAFRIVMDGANRPSHPQIVTDGKTLFAFATVCEGKGRVLKFAYGCDVDHLSSWRSLSDERAKALYPKGAAANGRCAVVWQEMKGRTNRIWHHVIGDDGSRYEKTLLTLDDSGVSAMPVVCYSEEGWWTAWHSDRDPMEGPTLVRSVEVAKISADGEVRIPQTPLPGIPRFGSEEDQGFEFPQILEADGTLIIVGRGSQRIGRQDLTPSGWTSHVQIDEDGWACRGRNLSIASNERSILLAMRERDGVSVRKLPRHAAAVKVKTSLAKRPPLRSLRDTVPPEKRRLLLSGYRVLFGDIHQHTAGSDGTGTIEEAYYRAKVRYGDDVVAVSDHESFLGKKTPDGEWQESCRISDEFYSPKKFVTLDAYEWTGKMHPGPGHKVVYLPPTGGPLFSRDDKDTDSSKGLLDACRHVGALAIPHHVGWTGADMGNHLSSVQTCFEIVSCHGAYEKIGFSVIGTRGDDKDGQFISDALDKNLRFGFTGGSDGHGLSWHHGISRIQDSHRTGLTAFLCHDVTRESVFDALKKRRCYATSGAKIGVWFQIDGRPMGEELMTGTPVPFRVLVIATAPIAELCLVTNGKEEIPLDFESLTADIHGTLPPPPKGGFSYYFIRVVQEDNHVAWSSPIWLDPLASA